MKKLIVSVLALVLALSFASCGADSDTSSANSSSTASVEESTPDDSAVTSEEGTASAESTASADKNSTASVKSTASSGKSSTTSTKSTPASSSKSSSAASSKNNSSAASTGKFASIQEYLNEPTVKQMLDSLIEAMASSGMNMTITGQSNKMIYSYTMAEQVDAATMKTALEQAIAGQEATFKNTAKEIALVVDVKNPVVIVRYLNKDGSLILEKEYTAK